MGKSTLYQNPAILSVTRQHMKPLEWLQFIVPIDHKLLFPVEGKDGRFKILGKILYVLPIKITTQTKVISF
jgi:hypothetical protein